MSDESVTGPRPGSRTGGAPGSGPGVTSPATGTPSVAPAAAARSTPTGGASGIDVTEVDLAREVTKESVGHELEPLQKAGFILAGMVLAAMVIGTIAVVVLTGVSIAPPPMPPTSPTTETLTLYKQQVDLYKQLSDVQLGRFTSMFQLVVVTVLLPSFTAIVGYTFGATKKAG